MSIKDIRESAILELYVLNRLTQEERIQCEQALENHLELRTELSEIEQSLLIYAQAYAITPPAALKSDLLDKIKDHQNPAQNTGKKTQKNRTDTITKSKSSGSAWGWFTALLLGLAAIATYIMKTDENNLLQQGHEVNIEDCEKDNNRLNHRIKLLESLYLSDNNIIPIAPTEKYPGTILKFHNNGVAQKNYMQVKNLPSIAENQSFQLWALKGENNPVPLDVFDGKTDLFEVDFVEGTEAYAITIEPLGGQKTPTLDRLIGVFAIES